MQPSIALEYFRRVDRGESVAELFDEHAVLYFPKWGIARGRARIESLFRD